MPFLLEYLLHLRTWEVSRLKGRLESSVYLLLQALPALAQPLNRATPYVAAAGHSPSSAMGVDGRAANPASWDLRFSPGALGHAQLPETRFCRNSPPQERISSAPEKHHEHRFAQHPFSKIQRADVRLLGGYLRQE